MDDFQYLFDLPLDVIKLIVLNFSLEDTDKFCNQVSKSVIYNDKKLVLKELCQEIWKIKYISKYGRPDEEPEDWRKIFMNRFKKDFRDKIKESIDSIEAMMTKKGRITKILELFDFIKENKEVLQLKNYNTFRTLVLQKFFELLEEMPDYEEILLDYMESIFGPEAIGNFLTKSKLLTSLF